MKKDTKKMKNVKTEEQKEIIKFLIILVVVVVLVVGIYFFTKKFVTKEDEKKEEITGTVNYNVTIVGELLNRPYDEYYVLAYDSKGTKAGQYQGIYSNFTSSPASTTKMYYIDLANKLNEEYRSSEETNPKATSISELKLGELTLIKVKDGKIVKYLEDEDAIKKELELKS